MKSVMKIDIYGYKIWVIPNTEKDIHSYLGLGILHREDGPAKELLDGTKFWYINNLLHREDGPAVEFDNGTKEWYINGLLHREDGPAVENSSGTKKWYINGLLHRENGPAQEYPNGDKYWWINGQRHREGGPAVEHDDGYKEWYIHGKSHREDGPAKEYPNNCIKYWYINDRLHREDGPAVEHNNDKIYWYSEGRQIEPNIEMMSKYIKSNPDNILKDYEYPLEIQALAICLKPDNIFHIKFQHPKLKEYYTNEMMSKYIRSNPDNILKDWDWPLEIQVLAISLKKDVIFNIKYPHPKLNEYFPQLIALINSGLT